MHFELFLGGWMTMFPVHTLVFTLWFVMVGPSFISSDDSFQEVVTFSTITIQKPMCRCPNAYLCAILWVSLETSCTDFMEGIPVVDTFIGWTTTNLQLMCHFKNSHLSVLQDHAIDLFHVCISNGCGLVSSSFPMLNTCATIFEPLDPFTDNPLQQDTVPILHWHHSMHFCSWYTFSQQKWITALCSSLVQMKLECPCLWHKTYYRSGLSRSHLHHNGMRGVDHVYLVMLNQQYSQLQNMYLHCG